MKKFIFIFMMVLGYSAKSAPADDFTLPAGFQTTVFADDLGYARHLAVRDDGAVYTILRRRFFGGGLVAMKDLDGDGVADVVEHFGSFRGTGMAFYKGYLYFATTDAVYRYAFAGDELVPSGDPEVIIAGLSSHGSHAEKPFTLDGRGNIYVNFGAPSNACQRVSRTRGSAGVDPCPQLGDSGGIWRFSAHDHNQTFRDGTRFVTGVRNAMGLDWNFQADALYFTSHGRDQLAFLWPDYFTILTPLAGRSHHPCFQSGRGQQSHWQRFPKCQLVRHPEME